MKIQALPQHDAMATDSNEVILFLGGAEVARMSRDEYDRRRVPVAVAYTTTSIGHVPIATKVTV